VVGPYLTQYAPQNSYRRVRPIGEEKGPVPDENLTL
jgi:hypothetical protein